MATKANQRHIEMFALIAGIIQPMITLPQIITIYANQSAQDVSLITWGGYTILGLILLMYGIAYKLRPIIVGQSIWAVMQTVMVVGILLYQ
jgi:uncharacterized protein with PQ loop repeat